VVAYPLELTPGPGAPDAPALAPVEYTIAVDRYLGQAALGRGIAPGLPDIANRLGLAADRQARPARTRAPRRGTAGGAARAA